MSTHIGNDGVVMVGANAVAEVTAFSLNITQAVADDSALSDAWDSHIAGSRAWSGDLTCWWDEGDTNGQVALAAGTQVSLVLAPEGSDNGDTKYSGTATITQIGKAVRRNSTVEQTFSFQGSGALATGTFSA